MRCLRGIETESTRRARLHVIVVDNLSEDGSSAAISRSFPWVEVIQRDSRGGFGAGHNLALRRAEGRHLLMLNDDTVLGTGTVDALMDYLDSHPEVALAAPLVADPAGRLQPSAWRQPTALLDMANAFTLGRWPRPLSRGHRPRRVGWVVGCAVMGRRAALLDVEGFDEGYFMYSEEVDLARRLADRGFETHWVPSATVIHEGQVSTGGDASPARAVEMARSRRRFWRTHYSGVARFLSQAAIGLEFCVLTIAAGLRGGPWRASWIQARGSWMDISLSGLREEAARFNERAGESELSSGLDARNEQLISGRPAQ
jgi:GT2 family glycosyltransferase